jgi:hypothetical protein
MENKEIENYILRIQDDELKFKNQKISIKKNVSRKTQISHDLKLIVYIGFSIFDFFSLQFGIFINIHNFKRKKIVFTANNFCTEHEGKLEDRIVKPLFTENILFINQSKEIRIKKINGQKVYNLGGLVKFISYLFFRKDSSLMRIFKAYTVINDSIISNLNGTEVYMLWFYDLNSLSLVFSKYRENIKLVEVQHGSIINYPPYAKPAPVKIADLFYVKNQPTIEYLKTHLCLNHPSEYRIIPYPKGDRIFVPGIHILYASTVEFNGLHPVMKKFLSEKNRPDIHLIVRLHPRERDKENLFKEQLDGFNIKYEFDHSKNWLEGNKIENLIVVSPWSSSIEDSFDNGYITIIIDPVGKKRFEHIIDEKRCFYSDNIEKTLEIIPRSYNTGY